MDIKELYKIFLQQRTISTDSRDITKGCIFFALKGENFNGNRFACEAVEKGAAMAIVDEDIQADDKRIVRVPDVLTALQQLAAFYRKQSGIKVIAITGSNGKTTTKELCREVLSKKYRVYATQGNLNNHIGVPLTLLSMESDTEIGIVEMGANHPGEIRHLCEIAQPDYGLITNIGKAHLEGFGSLEGVRQAKGELFTYLRQHRKTLIFNEGNEQILKLAPEDYESIIYYNGHRGIRAIQSQCEPFLKLEVIIDKSKLELITHLIGCYNVENVLAACAIGNEFGISPAEVTVAVQNYQPVNNRSQMIQTGSNTVIMDAYNANPSSMAASVQEFLKLNAPKKLIILGEMRELGDSSKGEHENIISMLAAVSFRNVIFVGKAFKEPAMLAGYQYAETTEELGNILTTEKPRANFILIKGSRSNRLEKILPWL